MNQTETQHTFTPETLLDQYLEKQEHISQVLEDNIYLQLEEQFPFLLLFHQPEESTQLSTLIRGESSYLILPEGTDIGEEWQQAIRRVIEHISAQFAGFLMIEIEVERSQESLLCIEYHQPQARDLAHILEEDFNKLKPLYLDLKVESKQSEKGLPGHAFMKDESSITWMKISLPDIFYRPEKDESYHVLLREFRDQFSEILRHTIFKFIRVQTSFDVSHAHLLGRSSVDDAFWEADRELYEIQKSFEFLLLVSAVNMDDAWQQFEKENFRKAPKFYYRLLPVDPEELKYRLYSIRIDDIHDSMLAFLIRDKRNELGKQLDMLQERNSKDFLYSSLRLYKSVDKELLRTAHHLLEILPARTEEQEYVDAPAFVDEAQREFSFFRQQDQDFNSKVHLGNDTPGLMVSRGELYVPTTARFRKSRVYPLIQHEVGTHVLTYYNGSCQPMKLMSLGLADYDELQEGLAVFAEYLAGGLDPLRIRLLAARVIVADMKAKDDSFTESFSCLVEEHQFTPETAFNIVGRIYQSGGFTKDKIYLRGFIHLWRYLKEGGDLPTLFLGKIGQQHVDIVRSLRDRNILEPARIIPHYWQHAEGQKRLNTFKETDSFTDIFSTDRA